MMEHNDAGSTQEKRPHVEIEPAPPVLSSGELANRPPRSTGSKPNLRKTTNNLEVQ